MNQINSTLDSIILGHNPFFGIDHLSSERGNEKAKKFENVERILEVIRCCYDLGVRGMMMSTHPKAVEVAAAIRADSKLQDFRLYPLVPYIQKYVRGSNEKGLVNLILDTLAQATFGQKINMILRGGKGFLAKDVKEALTLLVDVELTPFKKNALGAVFLHDTLTDLALGLGLPTLLTLFRDHVQKNYGVRVGLVTKNLPLLKRTLKQTGWENPLIMASFNSAGFYVNPSLPVLASELETPDIDCIAMNTLASGKLKPDPAFAYLAGFPAVKSVVIGVSRVESATETIAAIKRHLPFPRARAVA